MDILIFVARDPANPALGGGEIVMAEFARALSRRGHRVDLLCARFPGAEEEVETEDLRIHRVAAEKLLGPAAWIAYERHFRRKTDLVLTDVIGGARIPFFAPLYVRKPTISLWHQDHLPIFEHQYGRAYLPPLAALERLLVLVHSRSSFLVPSTKSRDELIRKGVDPRRIHTFHPGLPRTLLDSETPPPARFREPRIVCLGKIRRYKEVRLAILVLAALVQSVPQARLSVIGRSDDPAYLEGLKALAEQLAIRDRVEFLVNAPEEEKLACLRKSRALVAPSPIEGFGIAIAEANACGLPVVGTEGVPFDTLQEGRNGFRLPFGDTSGMARRAVQLLSDDELFDNMSREAHSFAQQFTPENSVRPLLALVEWVGKRGGN
jgi:glycosyltransferase involved in cell wall biosynthesis